ncbi:hypothetical protein SCUCBS95973_004302 [Sporothrix curviconia]|uniref:RanBD1 domain-containing protein n=1 Tax=Sporothrix curviconia TaxID=1260050 RepID=A0ABP0BMK2_9PEZI
MTDTDPASAVPSGAGSPKEDAATKSAREELKHTAISERAADTKDDDSSARRAATPDQHDTLKEQISSPKKKRAHDELDKDDEEAEAEGNKKNKDEQAGSSVGHGDDTDGGSKAASTGATSLDAPNGSGTRADEPEKKRLRDEETSTDASSGPVTKDDKPATSAPSSSAFASSGFAKLTSSASPFGNLGGGAGAKPALFGSSSGSASPFGALSGAAASTTKPSTTPAPPTTPALSFGGSSASPFASLQGSSAPKNVFGSGFGSAAAAGGNGGFGGGFGSGFGGAPAAAGGGARSTFGGALPSTGLTNFAKPGEAFKSGKPTRPFGAPDSDAAEESDDEDSAAEEDENGDEIEGGAGDEDSGEAADESGANKGGAADDKKKQRLQRVAVDDGEAGEATLLQVRARLYYLDKDLGGWKERGAGMLKINVPEQCVEFDRDGSVIPASFDASTLGEDGDDDADDEGDEEAASQDADDKSENGSKPAAKPKTSVAASTKRSVVRLIMRQDSTHRVILNTAVLTSTEFKERQTLKATTVLFTAFEGNDAKPVSMQAKMSIPNAKALIAALEGIQRELRGD